jgi:hypothetical protein
MKQRIKSPRTELVTVPSEFLDEPETENRNFGGVTGRAQKADIAATS